MLPKPVVATSRGTGGGRGRAADWPEATVAQAAAIYSIRNQGYPGLKRRISPHTISTISGFANTFFMWLEQYRTNVNDPKLEDFGNRFFTSIDVKVPSEYVKDTDIRNDKGEVWKGRDALFDEAREALSVKWITTVEKVALGIPLMTPVTIRYYFGRIEPDRQEEDTHAPLRYLIGAAMKSKIDMVRVISLSSSKLEQLPQVAEDDAFLGAKIEDEGWIRLSDSKDRGDVADRLTGWISSSIGYPSAEVGET
ncbi:MAG: hypothetical protein WCI87_07835 [Euryarchaeota archaeon]